MSQRVGRETGERLTAVSLPLLGCLGHSCLVGGLTIGIQPPHELAAATSGSLRQPDRRARRSAGRSACKAVLHLARGGRSTSPDRTARQFDGGRSASPKWSLMSWRARRAVGVARLALRDRPAPCNDWPLSRAGRRQRQERAEGYADGRTNQERSRPSSAYRGGLCRRPTTSRCNHDALARPFKTLHAEHDFLSSPMIPRPNGERQGRPESGVAEDAESNVEIGVTGGCDVGCGPLDGDIGNERAVRRLPGRDGGEEREGHDQSRAR